MNCLLGWSQRSAKLKNEPLVEPFHYQFPNAGVNRFTRELRIFLALCIDGLRLGGFMIEWEPFLTGYPPPLFL
jgi:hypothetical protein